MVGVVPLAYVWLAGKKKDNVTSITLVNDTAKTQDVTVPTGKAWLLLAFSVTNPDNVARDVTVTLYKEAAKTNVLQVLGVKAAMDANAAARYHGPGNLTNYSQGDLYALPLEAGNTISVTWAAGGASAGATDADGLVVEVMEIPV